MPAKSVETKIREALMYQLSQITTANGYNYTLEPGVTLLDEFPNDPYGLAGFPTVAAVFGNDARSHYDNELITITQKVILLAFVDREYYVPVPDQIDMIKRDVQHAIGNNPGLPDSEGNITCQLAIYASAETFGRAQDVAESLGLDGVRIVIDVTYQQLFTDPAVG